MSPKEVVNQYIAAKITKTVCMQKMFRQVCGRCRQVARCAVLKLYYEAWIELQALGKESDESFKRN